MKVGAPRTTSFSPDEMVELGQEMVEWVKSNKPLHLKQWYSIEKEFLYEEWKCFIQLPEFLPYYEKALSLVSLQYLDKTSNIRDGIAHRFIRNYFKEVKELEDQDLAEEAARKKDIISSTPQMVNVHVNKDLGCGIDVSATSISNPINQSFK